MSDLGQGIISEYRHRLVPPQVAFPDLPIHTARVLLAISKSLPIERLSRLPGSKVSGCYHKLRPSPDYIASKDRTMGPSVGSVRLAWVTTWVVTTKHSAKPAVAQIWNLDA